MHLHPELTRQYTAYIMKAKICKHIVDHKFPSLIRNEKQKQKDINK